jgi:hypothetical protein
VVAVSSTDKYPEEHKRETGSSFSVSPRLSWPSQLTQADKYENLPDDHDHHDQSNRVQTRK